MSVRSRLAAIVATPASELAPLHPAAARALVDWFSATLGGASTPAVSALAAAHAPLAGSSRLVGLGAKTSAPVAALVNGLAAHMTETDDIYAPGTYHPGAPTIAAALALADAHESNGVELLDALIVGYEVGCQVAEALGPEHYRYWHTTGTAGAVGAAAAAARLLDFDNATTADALGLAATMAAGLQQTFRTEASGKPLHSAHAAHAGVIAAYSANAGLRTSDDVFEGAAGLAAATGSSTTWGMVGSTLWMAPAITRVTVKPYPCCGHVFAPIDAAIALHRDGVLSADVVSIVVETYEAAIAVAGNPAPASAADRRFSIPFAVSAALRDGAISAESFEGQVLAMPPTLLIASGEFEARFPEARGARVRVTLRSGEEVARSVPDRKGSPSNPLSDADIESKLRAVSGARVADQLVAGIAALAHGGSVAELRWEL